VTERAVTFDSLPFCFCCFRKYTDIIIIIIIGLLRPESDTEVAASSISVPEVTVFVSVTQFPFRAYRLGMCSASLFEQALGGLQIPCSNTA
jgi:hypothetical protein